MITLPQVERSIESNRLWVRSLDTLTAREWVGTDNALSPFWSPDSQSLAFVSQDQLKTVSLRGESPRVLAEVALGGAAPARSSYLMLIQLYPIMI